MGYANYAEVEQSLRTFHDFRGNSCKGYWYGTEYHVYSYGTLIAVANAVTGGIAMNARKYSVTTSRLQNIIRRAWSEFNVEEVHTNV